MTTSAYWSGCAERNGVPRQAVMPAIRPDGPAPTTTTSRVSFISHRLLGEPVLRPGHVQELDQFRRRQCLAVPFAEGPADLGGAVPAVALGQEKVLVLADAVGRAEGGVGEAVVPVVAGALG